MVILIEVKKLQYLLAIDTKAFIKRSWRKFDYKFSNAINIVANFLHKSKTKIITQEEI